MKTFTLPLSALLVLSLGACGDDADREPRPEDAIDRPAGSAQDMLDRVGMAADDTYEPGAGDEAGDSMMLAGPLVEGRWRERNGGVGFGREGFGDNLTLRCADDGENLLVILPRLEREQEEDEIEADETETEDGEEAAEAAAEPDEARAGSVITANGMATGRFEDVDGDSPTWQMQVPADDPVLADLEEGERFGVSIEAQETVLVPIGPELIEQIEACRG